MQLCKVKVERFGDQKNSKRIIHGTICDTSVELLIFMVLREKQNYPEFCGFLFSILRELCF